MIREGSVDVAMGSAVATIKDAAHYITNTDDDGGIAKALAYFNHI